MVRDDRDVLETLKFELNFIEDGGYGRSVKTPWKETSVFLDSPTCFGFPERLHDDCCLLMEFVPPEHRHESLPCRYIPLNEAGETLAMLEQCGDQQRLEEAVKNWLRVTIKRLEAERAGKIAT